MIEKNKLASIIGLIFIFSIIPGCYAASTATVIVKMGSSSGNASFNQTLTDNTYLKLDQTNSQTVINGVINFVNGIASIVAGSSTYLSYNGLSFYDNFGAYSYQFFHFAGAVQLLSENIGAGLIIYDGNFSENPDGVGVGDITQNAESITIWLPYNSGAWGEVQVNGNINITKNATAKYYFGDGRYLTGLINQDNICFANGTNCGKTGSNNINLYTDFETISTSIYFSNGGGTKAVLANNPNNPIDSGLVGVHNYATANSATGSSGFAISAGSTSITNYLYNVSNMIRYYSGTRMVAGSDAYYQASGMFRARLDTNLSTITDGIGFFYNTGNAGNWTIFCFNRGNPVANCNGLDLGVPYTNNYARKEMYFNGSGINFYFNDTFRTHIPQSIYDGMNLTSWIGEYVFNNGSTAIVNNLRLDYVGYEGVRG